MHLYGKFLDVGLSPYVYFLDNAKCPFISVF